MWSQAPHPQTTPARPQGSLRLGQDRGWSGPVMGWAGLGRAEGERVGWGGPWVGGLAPHLAPLGTRVHTCAWTVEVPSPARSWLTRGRCSLPEGSPAGTPSPSPSTQGPQSWQHTGCGDSLHLLGKVLRVLPDGLGQPGHGVQHQVIEDHL